jgi:hypothetical protein
VSPGTRRPTGRGRLRGAVVVAGAAALAAAAVVAGVRLVDRPPPSTSGEEVSHVHGLGVNPADGRLYAATHFGLFRLDGKGGAERVGEGAQDTMGFTVAGPDRFLASGHPEFSARPRMLDERPLLGLMESRDGGRSWTTLSLGGEADFHVLVAAPGRILAWNATTGAVMASTDGRSWETLSERLLLSMVVDPADPERVLASGGDGVSVSSDGGRTWEPVAGPADAYLAAEEDGTLWAAAAEDGAVLRSRDGLSWERVGSLPGPAEALIAHDGRLYAAATEAGILRSGDGRSWRAVYRPRTS